MDYYINWGLCNLSTFKLPAWRSCQSACFYCNNFCC